MTSFPLDNKLPPDANPLPRSGGEGTGIELTRRAFLGATGVSLGGMALNELLAGDTAPIQHFAPKAKRAIYLFQSGAPSQLDLFDHKPWLKDRFAQDLPDSVRQGQRLTGMTANQTKFPVAPSLFQFQQHGQSGATLSELLPQLSKKVDEICFIKSVYTEAINHDPAITFITTGAQLAGRPCLGAWLSYGLGSENKDLPAFVAMTSRGSGNPLDQPLYDRLWGSGFLPSRHQGVKLKSGGDPVLYLSNPAGIDANLRRQMLDDQAAL
ncbi:MAG TPA: DUF1501 domain-containing protein, partial [Planctomycetaceae bacterium]|nr:DUF1501 domain-containing protein [Planctomycetaceae bacterium]